MATFTAKNFPADVGNNKNFVGSGERTIYAPVSTGNYKYKEGFFLAKNSRLYRTDGQISKTLSQGTKIFFTYPAELVRSSELGISGNVILAPVSLIGYDKKPDGLIVISSVIKPPGLRQGRIGSGEETQRKAAGYIKEYAYKKGLEVETEYRTAPAGSTNPDLIMTISKKEIQFEIKGTSNRSSFITFFDKSVRRNNQSHDILDKIALVLAKKDNAAYKVVSKFGRNSFIDLVDYYRSKDKTIGFAGDEGVIKSGKMPKEFVTIDSGILMNIRKVILDHLQKNNDMYFIIHDRSTDKFEIYYTNDNFTGNVLDFPKIPKFTSFALATYGGASSGATRIGFKIKL